MVSIGDVQHCLSSESYLSGKYLHILIMANLLRYKWISECMDLAQDLTDVR